MKKTILLLSLILCISILPACQKEQTITPIEEDPIETISETKIDADATEENTKTEIENIEASGDLDNSIDAKTDTIVINDTTETNELVMEDTTLYKVVRVVDGDTIVVDFNGKDEKVRLIGIDTPESVHPESSRNTDEGITASDFTKNLLSDKSVSLEFDVSERDKYGRLLAYVYLEGEMVNKTLLQEGYAQVATYPPNVAYVDDFTELQRIARENEVGFWGTVSEENIETPTESKITEKRLIGSINSNKYHKEGYTHNGQIADHNLVYFKNIEDAISKGYVPCKLCYK